MTVKFHFLLFCLIFQHYSNLRISRPNTIDCTVYESGLWTPYLYLFLSGGGHVWKEVGGGFLNVRAHFLIIRLHLHLAGNVCCAPAVFRASPVISPASHVFPKHSNLCQLIYHNHRDPIDPHCPPWWVISSDECSLREELKTLVCVMYTVPSCTGHRGEGGGGCEVGILPWIQHVSTCFLQTTTTARFLICLYQCVWRKQLENPARKACLRPLFTTSVWTGWVH